MATLHGTIHNVWGFTVPLGPVTTNDSPPQEVISCYVSASFTGTYAQADNADLLLVPDAIESHWRKGKTITLLDAGFAAPGDEADVPVGAKTVAVSGTTVTLELTGGDLVTEHANAALGTMQRDVAFYVAFKFTPAE
jgi:hypothetical protein